MDDDVIREVRVQADRIEDAIENIERVLVEVETSDAWRKVLGFVEAANRRGYTLRRKMLDEAIRRSREEGREEVEEDE